MSNYKFPSRLKIDSSAIERPLRRKFRRKTDYIKALYTFVILGTIAVTIIHFVYGY